MTDIWAMLEDATGERASIADLYHWSTNYDSGEGPFTLFLDMIGWSADNIGQTLYSLESAKLGYVELSKLGAALVQYADTPHDVRAFVDELMQAEMDS